MLKLLIADDHALVRDALKSHIERSCPDSIVETAGSVDEAVARIQRPDAPCYSLVILDLWMPGMDGLKGFDRVMACTEAPVAVMSGLAKSDDVQAALEAGAVGFLPKSIDGVALINVVRAFSNPDGSETALTAERQMSASSSRPAASPESPRPTSTLTRKENDVVGHLLLGMSNKEIARCLKIEEVTVKLHVKNICRKLDARNRTHAALEAVKLGYIAATYPEPIVD